jgi:predicted HicB family RNase H-like nuclease
MAIPKRKKTDPAELDRFVEGAKAETKTGKKPEPEWQKKFLLRFEHEALHRQLKSEAAQRGVRINDYIISILERRGELG